METRDKEFLKGILGIVLIVCAIWKYNVIFWIIEKCFSIISPLIYGCVIAYLLNLLVRMLEKHMKKGIWEKQSLKRGVSITLSVLIAIGVIALIMVGLVPEIVNSVVVLEEKLPAAINNVAAFAEKYLNVSGELIEKLEDFKFDENMISSIIENDTFMTVVKTSGNVIGGIISVFTKFTIGIFFAFYILMKKEDLSRQVKRLMFTYMKKSSARHIISFCKKIDTVYSGFISGQCLDAVILGLMLTVVMFIFQLPFPILMGVIVALTALVPVIGAFVGCAIGIFLIAIESPMQSLIFLIIFLVLQQIDNKIIYPYVVGNAVGLPSIWIFAAIIIGGNVSGVLGMFLGIPMAAILYALVGEDMKRKERMRGERHNGQHGTIDIE